MRRWLVAGGTAVIAGAIATAFSLRAPLPASRTVDARTEARPEGEAARTATRAPAPSVDVAADPREAPRDTDRAESTTPERSVDALLARLGSEDPFEVLDAADGLAARRASVAIPALASFRIARSPEAARSVVDALGRLAGAQGAERTAAVTRLRGWLTEEKHRGAPDSIGNVLTIYEALGHTRDASAARALEAELRDPDVSRAAKTVIVASLAKLRDPASRPVLEEARRDAAGAVIEDAFEDEVRGDLLAEIDRALRSG